MAEPGGEGQLGAGAPQPDATVTTATARRTRANYSPYRRGGAPLPTLAEPGTQAIPHPDAHRAAPAAPDPWAWAPPPDAPRVPGAARRRWQPAPAAPRPAVEGHIPTPITPDARHGAPPAADQAAAAAQDATHGNTDRQPGWGTRIWNRITRRRAQNAAHDNPVPDHDGGHDNPHPADAAHDNPAPEPAPVQDRQTRPRTETHGNPPEALTIDIASLRQRIDTDGKEGMDIADERNMEFARARQEEGRAQWEGRFAWVRQFVPRLWKDAIMDTQVLRKEASHGNELRAQAGLKVLGIDNKLFDAIDQVAQTSLGQRRGRVGRLVGGIGDAAMDVVQGQKGIHRERVRIMQQLREAVDAEVGLIPSTPALDTFRTQNQGLYTEFKAALKADYEAASEQAELISDKYGKDILRSVIGEKKGTTPIDLPAPLTQFLKDHVLKDVLRDGIANNGVVPENTAIRAQQLLKQFFGSSEFMNWYHDPANQSVRDNLDLSTTYGTDFIPIIEQAILPEVMGVQEYREDMARLDAYVDNLVLKVNVGTVHGSQDQEIGKNWKERAAVRSVTNRRIFEMQQRLRQQGRGVSLTPDNYMNAAAQQALALTIPGRIATHHLLLGTAAGVGLYAAQTGAGFGGRLVLPIVGGSVVAGAFKAWDERSKFTREYEQHNIQSARGETFADGARRRAEMRGIEINKRDVSTLLDPLQQAAQDLREGAALGQPRVTELVGLLADVKARYALMDVHRIDLLSAKNPRGLEVERAQLRKVANEVMGRLREQLVGNPEELNALLDSFGMPTVAPGGSPERAIDTMMAALQEAQTNNLERGTAISPDYQAALGNLSVTETQHIMHQQAAMRTARRWHMGREAAKTAAMGVLFAATPVALNWGAEHAMAAAGGLEHAGGTLPHGSDNFMNVDLRHVYDNALDAGNVDLNDHLQMQIDPDKINGDFKFTIFDKTTGHSLPGHMWLHDAPNGHPTIIVPGGPDQLPPDLQHAFQNVPHQETNLHNMLDHTKNLAHDGVKQIPDEVIGGEHDFKGNYLLNTHDPKYDSWATDTHRPDLSGGGTEIGKMSITGPDGTMINGSAQGDGGYVMNLQHYGNTDLLHDPTKLHAMVDGMKAEGWNVTQTGDILKIYPPIATEYDISGYFPGNPNNPPFEVVPEWVGVLGLPLLFGRKPLEASEGVKGGLPSRLAIPSSEEDEEDLPHAIPPVPVRGGTPPAAPNAPRRRRGRVGDDDLVGDPTAPEDEDPLRTPPLAGRQPGGRARQGVTQVPTITPAPGSRYDESWMDEMGWGEDSEPAAPAAATPAPRRRAPVYDPFAVDDEVAVVAPTPGAQPGISPAELSPTAETTDREEAIRNQERDRAAKNRLASAGIVVNEFDNPLAILDEAHAAGYTDMTTETVGHALRQARREAIQNVANRLIARVGDMVGQPNFSPENQAYIQELLERQQVLEHPNIFTADLADRVALIEQAILDAVRGYKTFRGGEPNLFAILQEQEEARRQEAEAAVAVAPAPGTVTSTVPVASSTPRAAAPAELSRLQQLGIDVKPDSDPAELLDQARSAGLGTDVTEEMVEQAIQQARVLTPPPSVSPPAAALEPEVLESAAPLEGQPESSRRAARLEARERRLAEREQTAERSAERSIEIPESEKEALGAAMERLRTESETMTADEKVEAVMQILHAVPGVRTTEAMVREHIDSLKTNDTGLSLELIDTAPFFSNIVVEYPTDEDAGYLMFEVGNDETKSGTQFAIEVAPALTVSSARVGVMEDSRVLDDIVFSPDGRVDMVVLTTNEAHNDLPPVNVRAILEAITDPAMQPETFDAERFLDESATVSAPVPSEALDAEAPVVSGEKLALVDREAFAETIASIREVQNQFEENDDFDTRYEMRRRALIPLFVKLGRTIPGMHIDQEELQNSEIGTDENYFEVSWGRNRFGVTYTNSTVMLSVTKLEGQNTGIDLILSPKGEIQGGQVSVSLENGYNGMINFDGTGKATPLISAKMPQVGLGDVTQINVADLLDMMTDPAKASERIDIYTALGVSAPDVDSAGGQEILGSTAPAVVGGGEEQAAAPADAGASSRLASIDAIGTRIAAKRRRTSPPTVTSTTHAETVAPTPAPHASEEDVADLRARISRLRNRPQPTAVPDAVEAIDPIEGEEEAEVESATPAPHASVDDVADLRARISRLRNRPQPTATPDVEAVTPTPAEVVLDAVDAEAPIRVEGGEEAQAAAPADAGGSSRLASIDALGARIAAKRRRTSPPTVAMTTDEAVIPAPAEVVADAVDVAAPDTAAESLVKVRELTTVKGKQYDDWVRLPEEVKEKTPMPTMSEDVREPLVRVLQEIPGFSEEAIKTFATEEGGITGNESQVGFSTGENREGRVVILYANETSKEGLFSFATSIGGERVNVRLDFASDMSIPKGMLLISDDTTQKRIYFDAEGTVTKKPEGEAYSQLTHVDIASVMSKLTDPNLQKTDMTIQQLLTS